MTLVQFGWNMYVSYQRHVMRVRGKHNKFVEIIFYNTIQNVLFSFSCSVNLCQLNDNKNSK